MMGYITLDFFLRGENYNFLPQVVPVIIIAVGFSQGIGSTLMPYMAMSCTIYGMSFANVIHWGFFLIYNLMFDAFVYHSVSETTIIETFCITCGIYTILTPWILYDYDYLFDSDTQKQDAKKKGTPFPKMKDEEHDRLNEDVKEYAKNPYVINVDQASNTSQEKFMSKHSKEWDEEIYNANTVNQRDPHDLKVRSNLSDEI